MKPRRFLILLVMLLSWIVIPASASRLGDIRVNARFLTDRMAYELRLTNRQYDDIFEINYDFFYNVDPYIDGMSYGDPYSLDMYYRYLDERNDDIRWVLSRRHYKRFMSLEHFFLPIYALNRVCYVRIYNIYPNRTYFYYGRPSHYFSYHGGHCRHHCGGVSFYQTNYRKHYRHSVYTGSYQSVRTKTRGRDFPVINHSGLSVTRPVRSNRHSVVTDGNRTNVRRSPSEVRQNSSDSRYGNSSVRRESSVVRRDHSSVRQRSESTTDQHENPYVRPARYDNRRYESSSTRVDHSGHSNVSHRPERSELRSRSHNTEVRSRTQRTSVRQRSTDSRSRSQSGTSTRSERSDRRGVRER